MDMSTICIVYNILVIHQVELLYVCCGFISNDLEYIESGFAKLILVSNQLYIYFFKAHMECILLHGFCVRGLRGTLVYNNPVSLSR